MFWNRLKDVPNRFIATSVNLCFGTLIRNINLINQIYESIRGVRRIVEASMLDSETSFLDKNANERNAKELVKFMDMAINPSP